MQLEIKPGTKKKIVRNKAIPSRAREPAALAIYAPLSHFQRIRGGGGTFIKIVCLPNLKNWTFSIPIFCPITHPPVYFFRKKLNLNKIYTQFLNLGYWVSMKPHKSLYQISQKKKKHLRGRHICIPGVNVRPPGKNQSESAEKKELWASLSKTGINKSYPQSDVQYSLAERGQELIKSIVMYLVQTIDSYDAFRLVTMVYLILY